MSGLQQKENLVEERQKGIGLLASGIFAVLGLAFLLFWVYNVMYIQNGKADTGDKVLLPMTIMMFVAGLAGFILIRRGRLVAGLWAIFGVVLIPPIVSALIIENLFIILISYIAIFASITIILVFPKSSRLAAIIATAAALLAIVGIEVWHPAFRVTSIALANFTPYVIALGGLGLLALSIRQAIIGNILTKLITAFVVIMALGLGLSGWLNQRSYQTSLTDNIGDKLTNFSNVQGVEIATILNRELAILKTLALNPNIQNTAKIANKTTLTQEDIDRLDQQWRAADAANNDSDPLVAGVLNNPVSDELRTFQSQFPQHVEVFLTGNQGFSIASTDRTSDYNQADEEWWQTVAANSGTPQYRDGQYIGQPEYDASSKTIAINMATVVRENGNGKVLGVLRTTVNFTTLINTLSTGLFGQTGHTVVLLPNGKELRLNKTSDRTLNLVEEDTPPELLALSVTASRYQIISLNNIPSIVSIASVKANSGIAADSQTISILNWRVAAIQDQAEALQSVTAQTRYAIILGVVLMIIGIITAIVIARAISGPIIRLNLVASKVAAGDLTTQAKVETRDEIGALATTFNSMTSRLREFFATLEGRVAERTADLEVAQQQSEKRANELQSISEISKIISSEQKLETLLSLITRLVSERFGFYHTGIFLVEETKQFAVLQAANSEGGRRMLARGHRLELGHGVVGYVAQTGIHRIALDVGLDSVYFNNPDLPTTRSEMALPLKIRNQVIGALDVQSEKPNAFTENDAKNLSILTDQIAIALENARLFERTQQALNEMQTLYRQNLQENWAAFSLEESLVGYHQTMRGGTKLKEPIETDDIRQVINRGITLSFNADGDREEPSVIVPIKLRGQVIGTLKIKAPNKDREWTSDEINLVEVISERLSIALENARLIQESQRQVMKQQTIRDMTEKISTSINLKNVLQIAVEELGRALPGSEVAIRFEQKNAE